MIRVVSKEARDARGDPPDAAEHVRDSAVGHQGQSVAAPVAVEAANSAKRLVNRRPKVRHSVLGKESSR